MARLQSAWQPQPTKRPRSQLGAARIIAEAARSPRHPGDIVFAHACKMGLEGIVSKRLGSRYVSGRTRDWLNFKNPNAPAVKREAEED
jgi:ATP-dependent DNA ligase